MESSSLSSLTISGLKNGEKRRKIRKRKNWCSDKQYIYYSGLERRENLRLSKDPRQ
jgi:hypothetical protein